MDLLKNNWIKIPVLFYVIGFVVHNSYLSNFGSHEFELVQAKYILSGVGAVFFYCICFAYISINVNISYVFDSLSIDKLLPWLLRIVSLPYVIYSYLYLDSPTDLLISANSLERLSGLFFSIAKFVVMFSILDLVLMYSKGLSRRARAIRSTSRVLSIPMIIGTFIIGWNNAEFSSVVIASTYLFFIFIGLGLLQEDRKHGIEPDYLDSNTSKKHQDLFTIFFGVISIALLFWLVVLYYVNAIYPKIPTALGGAKVQLVKIYSGNEIIKSKLIQESSNWILYINEESGKVEKLKSNKVDKIVYETIANKRSN